MKALQLSIVFILIYSFSVAQETGTYTDSRDGKVYKTVKIGNQIWMAENLAFLSNSGCWAYENSKENVSTYGYIYNWETAKNVCPDGWHLPDDSEWDILVKYFGGDKAGIKLKEKGNTHWLACDVPSFIGTNESGFNGLPGGQRNFRGIFLGIGYTGYFWSSKEINTLTASYRYLGYQKPNLASDFTSKTNGFSIRCIKNISEEKSETFKRDPRSKDVANVFWSPDYTLFCFLSDEPILPNNEDNYDIWYSSNEDPKPYHKIFTKVELSNHLFYKFKNYETCKKWCDSRIKK